MWASSRAEPLANGFLAGRYDAPAPGSTATSAAACRGLRRPTVARSASECARLAEQSGMTAPQLALKFVLDRPEIACAIVA